MEEDASRVRGTPSVRSTSPPTITASRGAARTTKSNSAYDATAGFPSTRPSKRNVYATPGGRLFLGMNRFGVFEYVVEGSSTTSVPSERDAEYPNVYPSVAVHAASIFSMAPTTRVLPPRGTAPFTMVVAAMETDILHSVQVTPSPSYPMGHFPQVYPVPGAGTSVHVTPAKHGEFAHPSMSTHPESPSPEYPPPAGHAPHVDPPDPLSVHVVSGSHPPFFTAHALMSVHPVSPEPLYPAGQAPHVRPPGVFVHVVPSRHPPLFVAHSSTSAHVSPSPSYPIGQDPQVNPSFGGAASVQSTPAKHGEFAHPSTFAHSANWSFGFRPYPLGQGPHVASPVTSSAEHFVRGSHPPFLMKHGFSLHVSPSPSCPAGHFPHVRPIEGALSSLQCTPAAHGLSTHAS